jgi:hypothetical protein
LTNREAILNNIINIQKAIKQAKQLQITTEELLFQKELQQSEIEKRLAELKEKDKNKETIKKQYGVELNNERKFWNQDVFNAPETLNFWFDFLDAEGELSSISVPAIGLRTKTVSDNNITTIYNRNTPGIIYAENIQTILPVITNTAYRGVQIHNIEEMFTISP